MFGAFSLVFGILLLKHLIHAQTGTIAILVVVRGNMYSILYFLIVLCIKELTKKRTIMVPHACIPL